MITKKVAILDYGIGNVQSLLNAFLKIDTYPVITRDQKDILKSDLCILPGVGAFQKGMQNLQEYKLIDVIQEYCDSGKPFMGICLGMQLLFDSSEEFGFSKGLGLIPGRVEKIPINFSSTERLPHVGWNELYEPVNGRWDNSILNGLNSGNTDVYFVHTYAGVPNNKKDQLAYCKYGGVEICSAVQKENIIGTQFHPEKSGQIGLEILKELITEI
jgi:glutamine amidotransferase